MLQPPLHPIPYKAKRPQNLFSGARVFPYPTSYFSLVLLKPHDFKSLLLVLPLIRGPTGVTLGTDKESSSKGLRQLCGDKSNQGILIGCRREKRGSSEPPSLRHEILLLTREKIFWCSCKVLLDWRGFGLCFGCVSDVLLFLCLCFRGSGPQGKGRVDEWSRVGSERCFGWRGSTMTDADGA